MQLIRKEAFDTTGQPLWNLVAGTVGLFPFGHALLFFLKELNSVEFS
jgi:hypothetical protein